MSETEKPRVEVDWVKVVAGALAAVSSAVLLSTLGAAGTLVGAALGSVVVSLATSVYGTGLARGTEKVAEAQTVALRKVSAATQQIAQVRGDAEGGDAPADSDALVDGADAPAASEAPVLDTEATEALEDAEQQLEEARAELEQAADPDAAGAAQDGLTLKERLAILPWKRVALASAGLFVIAMVLLTSFEVIGGRTISSYTGGSTDRDGGTSFGRTFRGGGDEEPQQPTPSPSDRPSGTATQEPSEEPTTDPTTEPTDEPTQTDDTETEDPSEDPTDEPTDEPTSPTRTPTTRVPSPTTTSPTR